MKNKHGGGMNPLLLLFSLLACGFAAVSCTNDDIPSDSYYTFTGQTIDDYLEGNADFSIYAEFIRNARTDDDGSSLSSLLNSYGYYTCFAPDNEAMTDYLATLECASFAEMQEKYGSQAAQGHGYEGKTKADSIIDVVAKMHVVSSNEAGVAYESKDFSEKLGDLNLLNRVIYISMADDGGYVVNSQAHITERDIECHNGFVHRLDSVVQPSTMKLQEFFAANPRYTIFGRLLVATDLEDRINTVPEDYDYVPDQTDYSDTKGGDDAHDPTVPQKKYFGYTVFVEPDEVYTEKIPAIASATTLEDTLAAVRAYAFDWFSSQYDSDSKEFAEGNTEDWGDPKNYFNRFVAYHVVNKKIDHDDFSRYRVGLITAYNRLYEFYESLAPNQLIEVSAGANGHAWVGGIDPDPDRVVLNPSHQNEEYFNEERDWRRPTVDGPIITGKQLTTENGFFHEISDMLVYPRKEFQTIRFRHDIWTIFDEVMSNNIRYSYYPTGGGGRIIFPEGYLSHIKFKSQGTIFLMITPKSYNGQGVGYGWNGMRGDEAFVYGNYDFVLRLPPVPAGDWEVRLGFTAAEIRGCSQLFLGTDTTNLTVCGIPVDMTQTADKYGFKPDDGTDADYDTDKEMRARGWMKGPNSWLCNNGCTNRTLRQTENDAGTAHSPLRYIMGRIHLDEDGPIYIRARNATTADRVELMMDYFEICPASIYDNPYVNEPRD